MKIRGLDLKKDKKGQEITLGTIILIILGIAVLIFLIWGFSTGWSNFWSRVTSFLGGGDNIETTKNACTLACDAKNEYDYCTTTRIIKYEDSTTKKIVKTKAITCEDIQKGSSNDAARVRPLVNLPDCEIVCPTKEKYCLQKTLDSAQRDCAGNSNLNKNNCPFSGCKVIQNPNNPADPNDLICNGTITETDCNQLSASVCTLVGCTIPT